MGKIRIRTLGDQELEKKQKQKAKLKQETKKMTKVPGLKGGERVVAVGPTEEELARLDLQARQAKIEAQKNAPAEKVEEKEEKTQKKKSRKPRKKQGRSKNYLATAKLIDKTKAYPLTEALTLLTKTHLADFDETVELHVNTTETGISGTVILPFGSGKEIRIAIANDQIIDDVQKGKIDFDILLATPNMMPKLAKVARFLGPKGLMPNPKNNTITNDPEKTALSFAKGQMNFKTEVKAPIIHLRVGKLSFGGKKLEENIKTVINAIKKEKIKNITLKSTMSPGLKLDLSF